MAAVHRQLIYDQLLLHCTALLTHIYSTAGRSGSGSVPVREFNVICGRDDCRVFAGKTSVIAVVDSECIVLVAASIMLFQLTRETTALSL